MQRPTRKQVVKSILFTAVGLAPGVIWLCNVQTTQAAIITGLGGFIGFAFSLPGVSAARVAGGVAGSIVANNVPAVMQRRVFNAFVGDSTVEDQVEKDGDSDALRRDSEDNH